jgi:hypothetical protein
LVPALIKFARVFSTEEFVGYGGLVQPLVPKIGETSPRLNTAAAIGTQTFLLDFKDMSMGPKLMSIMKRPGGYEPTCTKKFSYLMLIDSLFFKRQLKDYKH